MSDPYTILGVKKTASAKTIQKAYRKLALEHHPDRGGEPEKFAVIQRAYEVLTNPERRKNYDRTGDWGQTSTPHPMAGAYSIIATFIDAVVNGLTQAGADLEKENLAERVLSAMRGAKIEGERKERNIMVLLAGWKKTVGRWQHPGDEDGFYAGVVTANISKLEVMLKNLEGELASMDQAIAFMKDAKYAFDAAAMQQIHRGRFYTAVLTSA